MQNKEPKISDLIPDIYKLVSEGKEFSEEALEGLGKGLSSLLKEKLAPRQKDGALRMSNFGSPDRQLWYRVNKPELQEDLPPETYLKFLIGDLWEAVILFLAEQAGHRVELKQVELDIDGMKGHPDAVIDGVLVDVKTASGYGIKKFEEHKLEEDDPFFYLYQLSNYLEALQDNEELTIKKEGAFLACDTVDGKLVLDKYRKKDTDLRKELARKREMLASPKPPKRCYEPVPMGSSGNMKLPVSCAYCSFKKTCHPGLRTFAYSNGNVYLTHVVKEPDVKEIK